MRATFHKIETIGSGFLAVMARPRAGDWLADEIRSIRDQGVKQVVSLLERSEVEELDLLQEEAQCKTNVLNFESFPIVDRQVPDSIPEFLSFTLLLYEQIAGGLSTVVHCRAGIGRSGVVAGGVLLHCGFKPQEALQHISSKRGLEVPDTGPQVDWLHAAYQEIVSGS